MHDAIEQFRTAIHDAGLDPTEVIAADGKLRRYASDRQRGGDAGYSFPRRNCTPAGMSGECRTSAKQEWHTAAMGETASSGAAIPNAARLRQLARRCQPDLHKGSELATTLAVWLLTF